MSLKLPADLPRLPVEEGARHIALAHLASAAKARERLTESDGAADPDALHDFRVALRRLRSALRAYRPELRTTLSRRSYRRLRRLARATRESRDLEVHLAWIREQLAELAERQHPGAAALAAELEDRRRRADRAMLATLDADFARARQRLARQLERLRLAGRLGDRRAHTTAAVTGALVRERAAALESRLAAIRGPDDRDAIHAARITAKRLRYLLEPFEDDVDGAAAALARLQALQDAFGDVHDAQVFGDTLDRALAKADLPDSRAEPAADDPRPGLLALRRRLEARGAHAFDAAAAEWLGGRADDFFAQTARVADAFGALARADREIERKYLLRRLPRFAEPPEVEEIEQGYLPGERVVERLRRARADGAERLERTVKAGRGVSRLELEEAVAPELFAQLWPLTDGRRIHKRRYRVHEGARTWEVDEYLDRDLVVAEIELTDTDEADAVRPPPWLEPVLLREVTNEPGYTNRQLAR